MITDTERYDLIDKGYDILDYINTLQMYCKNTGKTEWVYSLNNLNYAEGFIREIIDLLDKMEEVRE